jgi:hypothetical protein
VRNLIDLAKSFHKLPIKITSEVIAIELIITTALSWFHTRKHNDQIEFHHSFENNVPPQICCDKDKMEQIIVLLVNLILRTVSHLKVVNLTVLTPLKRKTASVLPIKLSFVILDCGGPRTLLLSELNE